MGNLKRFVRDNLVRAGLLEGRSFGLNDLDKKLIKHVNFRRGVFVEAGANDGVSQSNTAYLEAYRGWKGVLVEPIPELAEICAKNRPTAHVFQAALVSQVDDRKEVMMTYCNLMSIVDGARGTEQDDAAHVESGVPHLTPGDEPRRVVVPVRTLDSILLESGFDHVDLLSLDVEGFEAEALRGLNFDRLAPTWILVEANDRSAIEDVLKGRYRLVDQLSHHDLLYRLI